MSDTRTPYGSLHDACEVCHAEAGAWCESWCSEMPPPNARKPDRYALLRLIVDDWEKWTDEQRLEFLGELKCCRHCGSLNTDCQCWNDE